MSLDLTNSKALHHRRSVEDLQFDNLPDNSQDFVVVFHSTGIRLTNATALVPHRGLVENSTKEAKAIGLKVIQVMTYKGYYFHKILGHLGKRNTKPAIKEIGKG